MSFLKLLQRTGLAATAPSTKQAIVDFTRPNELANILVRSDQELGGYSTAALDLVEENDKPSYGHFHGVLNLDLPRNRPDIVQSGYAMFRTRDLPAGNPLLSLFNGNSQYGSGGYWDWESCTHLMLKVKGDRRKYFVNIQAESALPTDIYQHRLFLKTPGQWETVLVPLKDFILTNWGIIQEQRTINTAMVKTVGIGLIDKQYGPFSLYIDSIKAINSDLVAKDAPKEKSLPIKSIPGKEMPVD